MLGKTLVFWALLAPVIFLGNDAAAKVKKYTDEQGTLHISNVEPGEPAPPSPALPGRAPSIPQARGAFPEPIPPPQAPPEAGEPPEPEETPPEEQGPPDKDARGDVAPFNLAAHQHGLPPHL